MCYITLKFISYGKESINIEIFISIFFPANIVCNGLQACPEIACPALPQVLLSVGTVGKSNVYSDVVKYENTLSKEYIQLGLDFKIQHLRKYYPVVNYLHKPWQLLYLSG